MQFNNLQLYARDQFRTRLTGTVSRDAKTGDFSGSGSGQIRSGNDLSSLGSDQSIRLGSQLQITSNMRFN